MNKLVESILKELRLQIFTEQDNDDKTIIAIYPGRFQPMGRHHKAAYDWLANQFGEKNTYIVTSDKTEPQRSPFNFAEKKRIINKHGIKNVVKVISPYFPKELLQKFDPEKTVLVYMIGEKDAGRLSGYKRLMKYNKTTAIPYKDITNPYAYYVYAPHVSYNIPDFGEMSGTNIRKALSDRDAKLSELKGRFKSVMGWFDVGIFNMVMEKMNSNRGDLKDGLREDINEWFRFLSNMTQEQGQLFFDILKKEYGDTKDLLPIIQTYIKTGKLSNEDKKKFQQQMRDTLKIMGLGAIAAIPIPGTMLLIPVIVQMAKKMNINLLPEGTGQNSTELPIVKREFWDKVFEGVLKEETLITEGGAAGHMQHPFDDMGLTFGDLKQMFKIGLSGKITTVGEPTEKLDGQNLFVTFKKGKLYAARNKGDIKSGGMDYKSIASKFEGRGDIEEAFTYSFTDLENAIQKLSEKQQLMIFKNGTVWMNLEVMYPKSANVINYDGAYIVFHGSAAYNSAGEKKKDYPEYARILAGMIERVNANTQKTFSIQKPKTITVGKSKQYKQKIQELTSELTALQQQMNCNDEDTLAVWHQRWWERFIKSELQKKGLRIEKSSFDGLVKRWAFYDKGFVLNTTTLPGGGLLEWAKEIESTRLKDQLKKNIRPFENIVLKFGAEVLKNVSDVMALNPDKTTDKIKSDVKNAIRTLSTSKDVNDLQVLKTQLSRIEAAGGIDSIVPLEGIVFNYNGKVYKLTGTFAPVNQLLGYLKFK
jgi:hypothetical protein